MINQEVARGVLIALVALLFLFQAARYPVGDLSEAGPGLFPMIIASVLLVIGGAIIVRSRFLERVALDFHLKNISLIIASLVSLTVISTYLNMFIAIAVMVPLASLASEDFSIKRAAAITVVLCLIALAMKNALGVQLPLY